MMDVPFRIAVTDLDSYKYFRTAEKYDGSGMAQTQEQYLLQLKRDTPKTDAMMRGTYLHKYIETEGRDREARQFIDFRVDVELPRPDCREMFISKMYHVPGVGDVKVGGRIDAQHGRTIIDYKGCGRAPAYEDFLDAWQWKLYLDMVPDATRFRYDCFTVYDPRKDGYKWRVVAHCAYVMQPYPTMAQEVEQAIREYVEALHRFRDNGLIHFDTRKWGTWVMTGEKERELGLAPKQEEKTDG